MSNIALQVQRTVAGSISYNNNVIFKMVVYNAGGISYNTATVIITFIEPG